MDKNIHLEHRKRMRESFERTKLEGFSDVQILEYLLFFFNAQKDTNPIAHALLDEFGSIDKVLKADPENLKKVSGIGEITAQSINFLYEFYKKVLSQDSLSNKQYCFDSPVKSIAYFEKMLKLLDHEEVHAVLLDSKLNLLKHVTISVGARSKARLDIRVLVENAIKYGASNIILAHNHPSSDSTASQEDIRSTEIAFILLQNIDISLRDHIIVGKTGNSLSFRSEKIMENIFSERTNQQLLCEVEAEYGNLCEELKKY